MRILVTGGTGFIGCHLVQHLVARPNTTVILLVRDTYANVSHLPPELRPLRPHFELVYADLRNFQLTVRAVQAAQPDCVVHLAAVGATNPFLAVDTAVRHNVTGTLNLLRAVFEKSGTARQLIVARTPGEQSAMNVYAASKAAAWAFCQMYARTQGWPICGAMIFQAYGPGQPQNAFVPAAIRAALAGQDFPMTSGTQERDWIYVKDVVAGFEKMLERPLPPGSSVDLGTGQLTAVREVAEIIYTLVGRGGRPLPGVLPARPGEAWQQVANMAQTREILAWETAVSLTDGLRQTIAHYQQHTT